QEVGNAQGPEPEGRQPAEEDHRNDLAYHPGPQGAPQVREDVASEPPPWGRHHRDDTLDVDSRVTREVDRHDELAHPFDQEFDPNPKVGDSSTAEEGEDVVQ